MQLYFLITRVLVYNIFKSNFHLQTTKNKVVNCSTPLDNGFQNIRSQSHSDPFIRADVKESSTSSGCNTCDYNKLYLAATKVMLSKSLTFKFHRLLQIIAFQVFCRFKLITSFTIKENVYFVFITSLRKQSHNLFWQVKSETI